MARLARRAQKEKERVVIKLRNRPVAAVVPLQDLRLLEKIEDRLDAEDFQAAKEEFVRSGEKAISWHRLKAELGLK